MKALLLFLGTGTSVGTPMIGCDCKVCKSKNPKNKRLRAGAALFLASGSVILLDASTDLRQQALKYNIAGIDAVLLTHHHADHIFGLDDLRIYNYYQKQDIPVFIPSSSLREVKRVYRYAFSRKPSKGGVPGLDFIKISEKPFDVLGVTVLPVRVNHGDMNIFGYRFGDLAYLTDVSGIPVKSIKLLEGLRTLILSALRYDPHPTHLSVDQAVETAEAIGAQRTYFTHLSHWVEHDELEKKLPKNIKPAWDGLELEFNIL